jgi:hypothetical protein
VSAIAWVRLAAVCVCALLGGCAAEPLRILAPAPASAGPELPVDRLIIAAVANRPISFVARAGGTP